MKKLVLLTIILFSLADYKAQDYANRSAIIAEIPGRSTSRTQNELEKLDSLNIDFQFIAEAPVSSSTKDTIAKDKNFLQGLPKKTDVSFPENKFYLTINENELSKIEPGILAHKLYLVNTTNDSIVLPAAFGHIFISTQVLNENKEWTNISHFYTLECGLDLHTVILNANEYWSFDVPVFKGKIKTKLRYYLATMTKEEALVSNEITVYINKAQMDEYNKKEKPIRYR